MRMAPCDHIACINTGARLQGRCNGALHRYCGELLLPRRQLLRSGADRLDTIGTLPSHERRELLVASGLRITKRSPVEADLRVERRRWQCVVCSGTDVIEPIAATIAHLLCAFMCMPVTEAWHMLTPERTTSRPRREGLGFNNADIGLPRFHTDESKKHSCGHASPHTTCVCCFV